jgi:hypothetical protein
VALQRHQLSLETPRAELPREREAAVAGAPHVLEVRAVQRDHRLDQPRQHFRPRVPEPRRFGRDHRAFLQRLPRLAADRARQRKHRRVRERKPHGAVRARFLHALREVVARALHAPALVERIAHAAERRAPRRPPIPPCAPKRASARAPSGRLRARRAGSGYCRAATRCARAARPLVAREHGLGPLERRNRFVVTVEYAQRIRKRQSRTRFQ